MKTRLIILFFVILCVKINATSQEPDRIILDNKEYSLLNNPLEKYFELHPEDHPIYGEIIFKTNKKGEKSIPMSTGNYRGYIATFKIENNYLTLIDIESPTPDSDGYISVYKKIFGDKKITLDYSGILVVPTGEYIDSANFGYSYLYTQYILMTIQKDSVIKQKSVDKDDFMRFKVNQFETYKKSEFYKNDIEEYFQSWEKEKESELSKNNTKRMSKREIEELKKQYQSIPKIDYIDNFFFVIKDIDYIIVDY